MNAALFGVVVLGGLFTVLRAVRLAVQVRGYQRPNSAGAVLPQLFDWQNDVPELARGRGVATIHVLRPAKDQRQIGA